MLETVKITFYYKTKIKTHHNVKAWLQCATAAESTLASLWKLTVVSVLKPLCHFCYATNIVFFECVKCLLFHIQCLDLFEYYVACCHTSWCEHTSQASIVKMLRGLAQKYAIWDTPCVCPKKVLIPLCVQDVILSLWIPEMCWCSDT